jgi:cyclic lactone autoinducer peptide
MKKFLFSKCLGLLSAALFTVAATATSTASMWIFQYQPKAPKKLLK